MESNGYYKLDPSLFCGIYEAYHAIQVTSFSFVDSRTFHDRYFDSRGSCLSWRWRLSWRRRRRRRNAGRQLRRWWDGRDEWDERRKHGRNGWRHVAAQYGCWRRRRTFVPAIGRHSPVGGWWRGFNGRWSGRGSGPWWYWRIRQRRRYAPRLWSEATLEWRRRGWPKREPWKSRKFEQQHRESREF